MPGKVTDFTEYLFLPLKNLKGLFVNISGRQKQMSHVSLTGNCPRRKIQYFYIKKAKDRALNFIIYMQIGTQCRNHVLSPEARFSS